MNICVGLFLVALSGVSCQLIPNFVERPIFPVLGNENPLANVFNSFPPRTVPGIPSNNIMNNLLSWLNPLQTFSNPSPLQSGLQNLQNIFRPQPSGLFGSSFSSLNSIPLSSSNFQTTLTASNPSGGHVAQPTTSNGASSAAQEPMPFQIPQVNPGATNTPGSDLITAILNQAPQIPNDAVESN